VRADITKLCASLLAQPTTHLNKKVGSPKKLDTSMCAYVCVCVFVFVFCVCVFVRVCSHKCNKKSSRKQGSERQARKRDAADERANTGGREREHARAIEKERALARVREDICAGGRGQKKTRFKISCRRYWPF